MFGINIHDLPHLKSFADCEDWWSHKRLESTPRIAAKWGDYAVPLSSPRMPHKALVKYDDRFALRLYSTELVVHYRDGRAGINIHDSRSSKMFTHIFLPSGMYVDVYNGRPLVKTSNDFGSNFYDTDWKFTIFQRQEDGYIPVTPTKERTRAYVDRKKANEVRKAYKPFLDFINAATKLHDSYPFPTTNWGRMPLRLLAADPSNQDIWPELAEYARDQEKFFRPIYAYHGVLAERALAPWESLGGKRYPGST